MFSAYTCFKINTAISTLMWFVIIVLCFAAMVLPAKAQETGPVNQGIWDANPIIVCPEFVGPNDWMGNEACTKIGDAWGPYPTKERCEARAFQMGERFYRILTMQTGLPHWAISFGCKMGGEAA